MFSKLTTSLCSFGCGPDSSASAPEPLAADFLGGYCEMPCFSADSATSAIFGVPIKTGDVFYMNADVGQDNQMQVVPAKVSLFINGVTVSLSDEITEKCCVLTPLYTVRYARLGGELEVPTRKIFRIGPSVGNGMRLYLACEGKTEEDANRLRSEWVGEIALAIRAVAQSIVPMIDARFCYPDPCRILAGYLTMLLDADTTTICVPFCELRVPQGTDSLYTFVAYENALCKEILLRIPMGFSTQIAAPVGVQCLTFTIENFVFATAAAGERRVWARALMNSKVKLANSAPPPSAEDIAEWRKAIDEELSLCRERLRGIEPVLQTVPRPPPGPELLFAEMARKTDPDFCI